MGGVGVRGGAAMSGKLAGRVALVTGGGGGIGEAIVRRFAEEGARVVVAEVDEESGGRVADQVGGLFVRTDVSVREQNIAAVEAAVRSYGGIDVLVNNAWGGGGIGRLEYKSEDQLSAGINVGYLGPFAAMQAAFPHMRDRGWGRVINMVSLNGIRAHMGSLEYNAAKEALRALTRTAAREWAPTGVTVNAIAPAAKSKAFAAVLTRNPELLATADAANPMGRIGDPYHDIAPVAVFLASDDSAYVTGNILFADGGAHINGVAWAPNLDVNEH
jgi:NAD(P)-dependent dehydrogenase (short-subunit alcohol dehydrogenase family)